MIDTIVPGPCSGTFLVSEVKQLKTKDKRPYTVLELRDKTGQISAFIWDKQLTFLRAGIFIKASGEAKEHDGRVVLKLTPTAITPIKQPDNLDDYVFSLDAVTINRLWGELLGVVEGMQDKFYKAVIRELISKHESFGEFNLRNCPLTDERYGAYAGALLEHIVYCCRHAKSVQQHYFDRNTPIDPDLLVATLILHDIGRLRAFENIMSVTKSDAGKLLTTPILSHNMTLEIVNNIPKDTLDMKKVVKLLHAVLVAANSQHNKPMFIEAMLAQKIQEMDALVGIYSRAINFAKHDQRFVELDILGTELFNG